MECRADVIRLLIEADELAQRLRRLALALAFAEERLAAVDDGSVVDVRRANVLAYECRRFAARLDDVRDDSATA